MKLGLSLSMGLSQTLSQTQGLSLETRLTLSQKLAQNLSALRKANDNDPPKQFGDVIDRIIAGVENPALREQLSALFSAVELRTRMFNQSRVFAVPTRDRVSNFAVSHTYHASTSNGAFIHARAENGGTLAEVPQTTFALFEDAFKDVESMRQRAAAERERLTAIIQSRTTPNVTFDSAREMEFAVMMADFARGDIETLRDVLLYLLSRKDEMGGYALKEFCLDAIILDKLDLVLSERLQRRFVKRFHRVTARSKPSDFAEAFLNTIAEYVLMSMGVISPSIFALQKSEVATGFYDEVYADFKGEPVDMKQLFDRYGLRTEGTFFWNRYRVVGHRPCRVTDQLIRTFITETVRKDASAVRKAANYESEFFPGIVDIVTENRAAHREEPLREHLLLLCENDAFQESLALLLRGWYKHLDIFYPQTDVK